jgi:hypothetical protein
LLNSSPTKDFGIKMIQKKLAINCSDMITGGTETALIIVKAVSI